jgi:hypothetical protein
VIITSKCIPPHLSNKITRMIHIRTFKDLFIVTHGSHSWHDVFINNNKAVKRSKDFLLKPILNIQEICQYKYHHLLLQQDKYNIYEKIEFACKYGFDSFVEYHIQDHVEKNEVLYYASKYNNKRLLKWVLETTEAKYLALSFVISDNLYDFDRFESAVYIRGFLKEPTRYTILELAYRGTLEQGISRNVKIDKDTYIDYMKYACQWGKERLVEELLYKGKRDEDFIMLACEYGHVSVVKLLLQNGYHEYRDEVFVMACKEGNLDMVKCSFNKQVRHTNRIHGIASAYLLKKQNIVDYLQCTMSDLFDETRDCLTILVEESCTDVKTLRQFLSHVSSLNVVPLETHVMKNITANIESTCVLNENKKDDDYDDNGGDKGGDNDDKDEEDGNNEEDEIYTQYNITKEDTTAKTTITTCTTNTTTTICTNTNSNSIATTTTSNTTTATTSSSTSTNTNQLRKYLEALRNGFTDIVEYIIVEKVDLTLDNWTSLLCAACSDLCRDIPFATVCRLIDYTSSNIKNVNYEDVFQETCSYTGYDHDNCLLVLQKLASVIGNDASCYAKDNFVLVCGNSSRDVVKYFEGKMTNQTQDCLQEALQVACKDGNLNIVIYLYEKIRQSEQYKQHIVALMHELLMLECETVFDHGPILKYLFTQEPQYLDRAITRAIQFNQDHIYEYLYYMKKSMCAQ